MMLGSMKVPNIYRSIILLVSEIHLPMVFGQCCYLLSIYFATFSDTPQISKWKEKSRNKQRQNLKKCKQQDTNMRRKNERPEKHSLWACDTLIVRKYLIHCHVYVYSLTQHVSCPAEREYRLSVISLNHQWAP